MYIFNQEVEKRNRTNLRILDICGYINVNYEELKKEISNAMETFNIAKKNALRYSDQKIMVHFLENSCIMKNVPLLTTIVYKLRILGEIYIDEFFVHIDFFNITQEIIKSTNKAQIVSIISDVNRMLENMMYQFDRIKKEENLQKQVSILKGMIAFY